MVDYFDGCLLAIEPFLVALRGDVGLVGIFDGPIRLFLKHLVDVEVALADNGS